MNTIERIQTRRSIRKFKPEAIPHTEIEKIISAASYAPSWKNTQTARYIIIEDNALIQKIANEGTLNFAYNQNTLSGCAALAVLASVAKRCGYERDGSFSTSKKDKWEMFDAGIAAQTFMLAASELGVGTVLLGIFDEERVGEIIGLPETQNVSALIAMGYPAEVPSAPPRKSTEELLTYK